MTIFARVYDKKIKREVSVPADFAAGLDSNDVEILKDHPLTDTTESAPPTGKNGKPLEDDPTPAAPATVNTGQPAASEKEHS